MRTKTTRKSTPNGVGKPPAQSPRPDVAKSPVQPPELSDADRLKLRAFLDNTDKPFGVALAPLSRKRKRGGPALQTQADLFEDRLTVQYEIRPSTNWECLRRYKRFTVGSESIAVGECILVKHDDSDEAKMDLAAQWKAKVLEVRALDPEHVYLRIAWLNRPEDLSQGRKPYHGKNELIPTNQLDVVDAMTVNGRLELLHWDEKDDDQPLPMDDQFFWRSTYDYANTKTYSALRSICIDHAPQNPDEMILQCAHAPCRKWMHVKCIAEQALVRADDDPPPTPSSGKKKKPASRPSSSKGRAAAAAHPLVPDPSATAVAHKDGRTAQVFIQGVPNGGGGGGGGGGAAAGTDDDGDDPPPRAPASATRIVVSGRHGATRTEPVRCLFCEHAIE